MKRIFIQMCLAACLLAASCKDDEDGNKFEGIVLRTSDNQELGTLDTRDLNDWQHDGALSARILALLDATPDHDLTGTSKVSVELSGAYPNPTNNSFTFQAFVGGPCLFEYVIVNEKMNVLFSGSAVGNNQAITFDVSDPNKFPHNKVIRMYYSFSSEGNKNFYSGHGDILVCHASSCRATSLLVFP